MKNLLLTMMLCFAGFISNANPDFEKSNTTNSPIAELIIIHGESNAAGRGLNSSATAAELATRSSVQILNNSTLTFQPIDIGSNNAIGLDNNAATEHGLELGLTNQKEAGILMNDIYVVKCGKVGSKIEDWMAGHSSGYWAESMARIDAAIEYMDGLGVEYRITVWQSIGLSDFTQYRNNDIYPEQFKTDMNRFRAQFRNRYGADIPFLATQFNEAVSGFSAEWNTAIQQLSDEDTYEGRAINVNGAAFNPGGDIINWSYAGLKTIASNMTSAMNSIWGTPAAISTYYVSPTGNNSNPGTLSAPFATWDKLSSVMVAGDIAYIRGGTYRTTKGANASTHCLFQNLHGTSVNPIKIFAYPGEFPVLNLDNITPTNTDPTLMQLINSEYVHFKGLRITGLKQHTGGSGISRGFHIENAHHCTFEFMEVDNIGGYGYYLRDGANDNYFLNCDAHHLDDRKSNPGAWGNANGVDCTGGVNATRNTFEGMRIWWCSDDGFDFYGTNGVQTLKNCWAFWNGFEPGTFIPRGDGDGFKLGPDNGGMHNTLLRTLTNCISFENKQHGFNQNVGDMKYKLYNNTSYKNGSTGFMWDFVSPAPVQDFKNNVSYKDGSVRRGAETNGSFNSWNPGVTVTDGDFMGLSSLGVDGQRGSDGSLPVLNFLRLVPASDLINSGTDVGLPFVGSAPDRGAFESGSVLPVKMVDLAATAKTNGILVQWATLTEENSDRFLLERSSDGVNFTSIATVNAHGNSSTRIDYNYMDIAPVAGINYYRIRIIDRDGQFEYSRIVGATMKDKTGGSFEIISSSLENNILQLNINSAKQQIVKIGLYDGRGRMMLSLDMQLQKGINNIKKPVFAADAVYYCKIVTPEETKSVTLLNR